MYTRRSFKLLIVFFFYSLMIACGQDEPLNPIVGGPSNGDDNGGDNNGGNTNDPFIYTPTDNLKNIATFPVGMIVSANKLTSTSEDNEKFKAILTSDFNSITAENDMKMANMFPAEDTYDFSDGDVIVAYAKSNGMRVHGHALIWHQSVPGWLSSFAGTDEEFTTQIENYVKATVAHFAQEKMTVDGKEVSVVASWDVVNEAWDGASWRSTIFRQKIGNDYVSKLFKWAREADPEVKLFYNDYNVAGEGSKRNAIITMINDFKTNGVPIDGLGMQMHINYNWPSATSVAEAVSDAIGTGLLIHFSEIDVKVNSDDDLTELTEERAATQEETYRMISEEYSKIPAAQQFGITTWGMRDRDSWLYQGGTEWPLMYDNDFNYKIAHRGFAEGLKSE